MKSIKLSALFLALVISACGQPAEQQAERNGDSGALLLPKDIQPITADIVIQNVTIIDAVNGQQGGKTVVVHDDKISQILDGSMEQARIDAAIVIDGSGKYLIPGLWDAHVHTTFDPAVSEHMRRLFTATGITSVRDTGGQLDLVLAWRDKTRQVGGPRTYIAGPLIDGLPTVYAGEVPGYPKIAVGTQTPEQVIELVDELVAAGVDLLKAYEMLSPESFKALIAQAHKHGLPVTGHVPLSMTAIDVAKAGLDSMEHLRNLEMDCSAKESELFDMRQKMLAQGANTAGSKLRSDVHGAQHYEAVRTYDAARCKTLLAELAQQEVWQIPTLTLMLASSSPFYVQDEWRQTFNHLPAEVRTEWLAKTAKFKATSMTVSPARQQRIEVADWKKSMIMEFINAGVPIMAGTDTPIFFLTPGFSLHKELQTLVSAGMTPMQALESATITPAKYFKLEDQQGSIAQGMLADLVLLNANPLLDISNTLAIDSVIQAGRLYDRASLDSLLVPAP